jgi:tetratricopeptide (TPR) repeat protein
MRTALATAALVCLLLATGAAPRALAQDLPQECKDAQEIRSPQGQVDMLTRCLDTGRLAGEGKATTFKQRAIAYMHLGRHQLALDDINQAMKLKPDDADVYYLRGFAYRALGQYQRALEDSNRAIGMDPSFAAAYANRAFAHKALGNASQARSDARRAHDLDPTVKVPWF